MLVKSEQKYFLVDVFADEPLTGNPLAVVPDADALPDAQMRAIAKEFNLSETTFLVRPSAPSAAWRLRSFTPGGVEVGGAGTTLSARGSGLRRLAGCARRTTRTPSRSAMNC